MKTFRTHRFITCMYENQVAKADHENVENATYLSFNFQFRMNVITMLFLLLLQNNVTVYSFIHGFLTLILKESTN